MCQPFLHVEDDGRISLVKKGKKRESDRKHAETRAKRQTLTRERRICLSVTLKIRLDLHDVV